MNANASKVSYLKFCIAIAFGCAMGSRLEAAFMNGKNMQVNSLHATIATGPPPVVDSGEFVVGPDVELPDFGFIDFVDIDVSDTSILITLNIDQPFAQQEELHFIDSVPNDIPFITGVSINPASNWVGFTNPLRVNNAGEAVFVNLAELSGLAGQQILLDLTFIPEPAAAAGLLSLAGVALAASQRRRRA
jgi:hypothetical protein